MEDQVTPPDMQVAGAASPPQDTQGLIGAMRSQGSIPSNLMESLRSPRAAFAMAAAGGMNPGQPNPVFQQGMQLQNQQMQQYEMIQKQKERKAKQEMEKNKTTNSILEKLLFGDNAVENEDTRNILAKQYASGLSSAMGQPLPSGVVNSWTKGGPSNKSQVEIATTLAGAEVESDPQSKQILEAQAKRTFLAHGGKEQEWEQTKKLLTNPIYRESAKIPSQDSLVARHYDAETKRLSVWSSQNPEWKDQGHLKGLASWGNEYTRRKWGKSIDQFDPNIPEDAAKLQVAHDYAKFQAARNIKTEEEAALDKFREQEKIRTDEALRRKTQEAQIKGLNPPVLKPKQMDDIYKPWKTIETYFAESSAMRGSWERADQKNLLPKNAGQYQKWRSKYQRFINEGDTDLVTLKQLTSPIFIGLIDRGLNDEKGTRAMQMFHAQLDLVNNNPTVDAYEKLFGLYDYLFARLAMKELKKLELQKGRIPDEVIEDIRDTVKSLFPNGIPRDPSVTMPTHNPSLIPPPPDAKR